MRKKRALYLIINDVRSTHNVGSLFRTADGMGVSKIFLTGYTPAPIDRFGRKDSRIQKVSLGAEETIPWEQREAADLIKELQNEQIDVLALEQTTNSIPLHEYTPSGDVALIVGNEVDGIEKSVLDMCDAVVQIPMQGEKESLNVSNAGAIALYRLRHTSS